MNECDLVLAALPGALMTELSLVHKNQYSYPASFRAQKPQFHFEMTVSENRTC
jgi:hypothetical protein